MKALQNETHAIRSPSKNDSWETGVGFFLSFCLLSGEDKWFLFPGEDKLFQELAKVHNVKWIKFPNKLQESSNKRPPTLPSASGTDHSSILTTKYEDHIINFKFITWPDDRSN